MMDLINTIGPYAIGLVLYGFPIWLAWWLSDGFAGYRIRVGCAVKVAPAFNPYTGTNSLIVVNAETNAPNTFPI